MPSLDWGESGPAVGPGIDGTAVGPAIATAGSAAQGAGPLGREPQGVVEWGLPLGRTRRGLIAS